MSLCEWLLPLQVKVHERNVSVNNVEVKARHLWGCDVYTDDSDVVAALMHCGFHEAAKAHNPPGAPGSRGPPGLRAASSRRPPSCTGVGSGLGSRPAGSCTHALRGVTIIIVVRPPSRPANPHVCQAVQRPACPALAGPGLCVLPGRLALMHSGLQKIAKAHTPPGERPV